MKLVVLNLLFVVTTMSAYSMTKYPNLECKTPRGEKVFHVFNKQVVFKDTNPNGFLSTRGTSSNVKVRTRRRIKGYDKFLTRQGHQYKIHIEDVEKLNAVDDYVTITSPSRHKLTYPLDCRRL